MKVRIIKNTKKRLCTSILFLLLMLNAVPNDCYSQIRSGAAFLKILPGSRQQGMAGSLTGAIDEMQSLYANPGATGFLREWQWSGTYTKWMADIYSLSLNYGKNIPTFLSRDSRFALGINYLGVKEFDSTLRNKPSVGANDFLAVFSYGNPINFISQNLSFGANIKYMQSKLSFYNAETWIYDVGLLLRSNRFNLFNGLFRYGIISGGVAITQLGNSLNFKSVDTPLPRTLRAGAALNIGTHKGIQIQIAADYKKVRDEIGRFSLGSEISWGYRFALRGGYNFNDFLLSKLSLGLSVRIDDHSTKIRKTLSGKNNALRVDLASLESNEFFSASFRGTVNHYPIRPERFDLLLPAKNDTLEGGKTQFVWEISKDPDLYDNVKYFLLLEKKHKTEIQNTNLFKLLKRAEKRDYNLPELIDRARSEMFLVKDSDFSFYKPLSQVSLNIDKLPAGDYFWTVIAYDLENHYRVTENKIFHFHILWPDIQIKQIEFDYNPWITECDTQGVINVQINNAGEIKAKNILVTISSTAVKGKIKRTTSSDTIFQKLVPQLAAQETHDLQFNWLQPYHGLYNFYVNTKIIEPRNKIGIESNMANNDSSANFYTIPKGNFATKDTVTSFIIPYTHHNIPFASRVFFGQNSSEVKSSYYYESDWLYPPFKILAERLKKRPDIYLRLKGFADSTTGETLEIAKSRVESIRNILLILGVPANQIPLDGLKWSFSPNRKVTSNDDVKEERRFVKLIPIRFDNGKEDISILESINFETLQEKLVPLPVEFTNSVKGFVPLKNGNLVIKSDILTDTVGLMYADNDFNTINWQHEKNNGLKWINKTADYQIVVVDSLHRLFKTRKKQTYLAPFKTHLPLIVGLAEFNNSTPYPITPLDKLLQQLKLRLKYDKKVHIRFIGHACGIPPRAINNKFSNIRAQKFQKIFLTELNKFKNRDPELFRLITERLEQKGTIGKGSFEPYSCILSKENLSEHKKHFEANTYKKINELLSNQLKNKDMEPFIFELKNDKITLTGDNDSPEGRQINRRIEIQLFFPDKKLATNSK